MTDDDVSVERGPTNSTVTPLFRMDTGRIVKFHARLQPMADQAAELMPLLNSPAALETAGRGRFLLGLAVLLGALLVPWLFSNGEGEWLIIVLSIGCLGIWLIEGAVRQQLVSRDIRRRAAKAKQALEGQDGFLWRFEALLHPWTYLTPAVVANSLRTVCQASKDGELEESQEALRAYWHWVDLLVDDMEVLVSHLGHDTGVRH